MNRLPLKRLCVVICTHSPDVSKLLKVLDAISNNTKVIFRIVLVENNSADTAYLKEIEKYSIEVLIEPRIGNAFARFTGLQQQKKDELLVFVDDDNYLAHDYLKNALAIANKYPKIGVFGGNTHRDESLKVAHWKIELLQYLGVRTIRESKIISESSLHWNPAQPIGAGMCVRPEVTDFFFNRSKLDDYFSLGRAGSRTLSGEDSFIANQCHYLQLKWGVFSSLNLIHDIAQNRVKVSYLVRLLFNYGCSDVIKNSANRVEPDYPYPRHALEALARYLYFARRGRAGMIIGLRQFGAFFARRKFTRLN